MNPTSVQYCQTIHQHFSGFYAAWPPNAPLRLGDFGRVSSDVFDRKSNLATFDLEWKTRRGGVPSTYSITTGTGSTMKLGSRGGLDPMGIPLAKANVEFSFFASGAVLFHAAECTINEIDDQQQLGKRILDMFLERQWDDDWYVVTRLVCASSTTVAISEGAGGSIRFEAVGDQPQINLADASAKLTATSMSRVSTVITTETGLTPLVGLSRVRRRLLRTPVFGASDFSQQDSFKLRELLRTSNSSVDLHFEFVEM